MGQRLCPARHRFWREAPLADFKNGKDFEAWLQGKPREVAVALAARAALRVLPVVQTAKHEGTMGNLVLPVFRATAVAWAAANNYPAHETEPAIARAADTAFAAFAVLSFLAAVVVVSLMAFFLGSDSYAWSLAGIPAIVVVGLAVLAAAALAAHGEAAEATAAPALAVLAALADAADAEAAEATAAAARAVYAARTAAAAAADAEAAEAAPPFWSALSTDATRLEEGATASDIARSPLWPQGQPDRLRSLWQELEAALLAAKQDWQVWTIWYGDRLDGRVREEERELAYVRFDNDLWDQSPAAVNAEIKRRVEGG